MLIRKLCADLWESKLRQLENLLSIIENKVFIWIGMERCRSIFVGKITATHFRFGVFQDF